MLILKINFKKIKKYYFYIFLSKITLKNNLYHISKQVFRQYLFEIHQTLKRVSRYCLLEGLYLVFWINFF
jgi:hypothetical protein